MSQYKEKYHKAARDGYLDILREASRKDCDTRDEDGMTPVMWSSFYGRLDALRLLMTRGGNPDLTDYLGNTALHHASANGHLPCCTFLVNFGANIWALDNDLHSALDIAVLRNQREVIDFLDAIVGKQRSLNKRLTTKLQQRAVVAAEKRRKQYERLQAKAQKRLEKEETLRLKQRQKMTLSGETTENFTSENIVAQSSSSGIECPNEANQSYSVRSLRLARSNDRFSATDQTLGSNAPGSSNTGVARKVGKKKTDQHQSNNDFRISQEVDGLRSVRSLTGLRRDSEILYATSKDPSSATMRDDLASRALSEPESAWNSKNDGTLKSGEAGLFERPGFGSVAFFSKPNVSDALMSLPGTADNMNNSTSGYEIHGEMEDGNTETDCHEKSELNRNHSYNDSIGTARSLLKRMRNLPWSEEEVENLDDDQATNNLELFLACYSLTECASMLNKEKIDLDALLLCNDEDLKKIGLQLGPRKKLMDAIEKRKRAVREPGRMFDTFL